MQANKKTILSFGDSLTFGFNAKTNDRFDYDERWTTLVERRFNYGAKFIVEGQGGRTISEDDDLDGKNGLKAFAQALYSHLYIDYIFIMLGTNNLKDRFRTDAVGTALKFEKYQQELEKFYIDWEIKKENQPKIILIAPPKIDEKLIPESWTFVGAQQVSNQLASEYQKIVEKLDWHFIDASNIEVDNTDGVHLDEIGNIFLSDLISEYINKNIKFLENKQEGILSHKILNLNIGLDQNSADKVIVTFKDYLQENYLEYCNMQNGRPDCKNCGLDLNEIN